MIELILMEGEPDQQKRRCYDCFYLRGAVSLWCRNKKAAKEFNTRIPGRSNCQFWKPMRMKSQLSFWERFWGGGVLSNWMGVYNK